MQFPIINMLKIKTKCIEQIYILFFCNTSSEIKFLAPGIFLQRFIDLNTNSQSHVDIWCTYITYTFILIFWKNKF